MRRITLSSWETPCCCTHHYMRFFLAGIYAWEKKKIAIYHYFGHKSVLVKVQDLQLIPPCTVSVLSLSTSFRPFDYLFKCLFADTTASGSGVIDYLLARQIPLKWELFHSSTSTTRQSKATTAFWALFSKNKPARELLTTRTIIII